MIKTNCKYWQIQKANECYMFQTPNCEGCRKYQFKVSYVEIPNQITIILSEEEKCIFARLLTKFGFGVDVAGDTFQHLYHKGLMKIYEEYKK